MSLSLTKVRSERRKVQAAELLTNQKRQRRHTPPSGRGHRCQRSISRRRASRFRWAYTCAYSNNSSDYTVACSWGNRYSYPDLFLTAEDLEDSSPHQMALISCCRDFPNMKHQSSEFIPLLTVIAYLVSISPRGWCCTWGLSARVPYRYLWCMNENERIE